MCIRDSLIALEQLAIGLGHPLGRFHQALAVGVVARPLDQGANGGFGFGLRDGGFVRVVGHSVSIKPDRGINPAVTTFFLLPLREKVARQGRMRGVGAEF